MSRPSNCTNGRPGNQNPAGGGGDPLPTPTDPGDVLTLDAGLDPVWLPPSGGAPIGTPGDFAWFARPSGNLSDGSGTNRNADGEILTFESKSGYAGEFDLWKREIVIEDSDLAGVSGDVVVVNVADDDNTFSGPVKGGFREVLTLGNCDVIGSEIEIDHKDPAGSGNGTFALGYLARIDSTAENAIGFQAIMEDSGNDTEAFSGYHVTSSCGPDPIAAGFFASMTGADCTNSQLGMPVGSFISDGGTWQMWESKEHGGIYGSQNKPLNASFFFIDASDSGLSTGDFITNQYRTVDLQLDASGAYSASSSVSLNEMVIGGLSSASTNYAGSSIDIVVLDGLSGSVADVTVCMSKIDIATNSDGSVGDVSLYSTEPERETGATLTISRITGYLSKELLDAGADEAYAFLCLEEVTSTTRGSWRVGDTVEESHPNVGVEIADIDKVLALPLITEAQRDALPTPEDGWVVLVSDGANPGLQYASGGTWLKA